MTKSLAWPAAFLLLVLPLASSALAQSTDPKPFLGAWTGTLSAGSLVLEIALDFTLDASGSIQGTIDSITQGAFGIALGGFAIKDRTISFFIVDPNVPGDAAFKGSLDETGKRLAGEFTQSGSTGTFSVDKQ